MKGINATIRSEFINGVEKLRLPFASLGKSLRESFLINALLLPVRQKNAFVVGDDLSEVEICLSSELWSKIGRSNEAKQVSTEPVILVADCDHDRDPKLPKLSKL